MFQFATFKAAVGKSRTWLENLNTYNIHGPHNLSADLQNCVLRVTMETADVITFSKYFGNGTEHMEVNKFYMSVFIWLH